MLIPHIFRMLFIADIPWYLIHRTGTVQRNARYNILQRVRAKFLHKRLHTRTFHLENTVCISIAYSFINLFNIIVNIVNVKLNSARLFNNIPRIFNNSKVLKPQKIHF